MKYMILAYASQRDYDGMAGGTTETPAWTSEELAAMTEFMSAANQELADSGELIETRGLAAPVHTRRVSNGDGAPFVTDGPYAETQEVLAGYWIVECESLDRATEIAVQLGKCPAPGHLAGRGYADVRPIVDGATELVF
ncbi:YciI family protein [Nocardia sp. NPDC056100]|uniref:YciI family protein n=1 Tax=Nocardia sp. NPDC056100 TaxID=3345712 RepID=UPI0035D68888